MFIGFLPAKRHPIRGLMLGAFLLALAASAAGEPARHTHGKKHVAAAKQVQAAPASAPTMAISAVSAVSGQPRYLRPFELDYATRLAKSSAATPSVAPSEPDVRPGAPAGPLSQVAQVDTYGLLSSSVRPQLPPLVTIGEWNFSAAAHVPVTRARDAGAAISAEYGF
jgi:hypothetical protein